MSKEVDSNKIENEDKEPDLVGKEKEECVKKEDLDDKAMRNVESSPHFPPLNDSKLDMEQYQLDCMFQILLEDKDDSSLEGEFEDGEIRDENLIETLEMSMDIFLRTMHGIFIEVVINFSTGRHQPDKTGIESRLQFAVTCQKLNQLRQVRELPIVIDVAFAGADQVGRRGAQGVGGAVHGGVRGAGRAEIARRCRIARRAASEPGLL